MREERRRDESVAQDVDLQSAAVDHRADASSVTYSNAGSVPAVAGGTAGIAGPSASERAYVGEDYSSSTVGSFGGIGAPRKPLTQLPLTTNNELEAHTARKEIEGLLLTKGMEASASVKKALDLLIHLSDDIRGKVVDGLAPKALDYLLDPDRLSDTDRQRLYELVKVSQDPERKLRIWGEAHKAKVTSNVEKKKGDIGGPIPTYEDYDDNDQLVEMFDEDAENELRGKLGKKELRNRKRHFRREKAAETTRKEVDTEQAQLKAKHEKDGTAWSLQEVNDIIERKELEYQVELESNVNLTNDGPHSQFGVPHWEKDELVEVQRVLSRVPQGPDGFSELRRVHERGMFTGGQYIEDENHVDEQDVIEITDFGATTNPGFRHGGDDRQLVSDDYKKQHGDKIGTLEFVLTHEIGHDHEAKHTKEAEAFRKAAGWEQVKVDALIDDGVSDEDIATLEARRPHPSMKGSDIQGRTKMFVPDGVTKGDFWAVPVTAIPSVDEATLAEGDPWIYARATPAEHFAETYAKAVHVPEKLYDDLVLLPRLDADAAREEYEKIKPLLDKAEREPRSRNRDLMLVNLKAMVRSAKAKLDRLEAARDQRKAQFDVMRDTVFGTDKAVKLSVQRLREKKVSEDKIEEFQQRATAACTPEQVAVLEAEAAKK